MALAWMISELNTGPFSEGYARLVRAAGHAGRAGWHVVDPVEQGERPAERRTLTGVEHLTAELLGATLVDAQDELWVAWSELERAGSPEKAVRWMTEPPPWPAASVTRIMDRQGEAGLAMLETLAAELAPVASTRAWLTLSWIGDPAPIGSKTLEELADADEGRLIREPRVRAWLRAEWTAWARQRYRRVARSVGTVELGGGARAPKS